MRAHNLLNKFTINKVNITTKMSTEHIVVHLFAVQFIASDDAGLALIVARTSNEATQILKNSGEHNCNNGSTYIIQKIQDIGVYTLDDYGILFEMYANAAVSYDAIITALDSFSYVVGPKGEKGDKGDPGSDAEVTLQNIISALGYTPASLESLSGKQDTLVSGTNIKTVNNQSILGEGNITIESEPVDTSKCVKVEEQTFTSAQQALARSNIGAGTSNFSGNYDDLSNKPAIPSTTGLEEKSNKVTSLSSSSTDVQYPSAKCVYEAIQSGGGQADTSDCVKVVSQSFSSAQKSQARTNIGAGTSNFSGAYNDLTGKPTIPAAQIQSDWNQTDNTALDFIKNKPSIPSVSGLEETSNKTLSLSSSSTNAQYPSAKATYDEIHPASGSSQPSGGMVPNVLYNLGTLTGSVTFTLATPSDANVTNHYYWTFNTSSTAPTITWPSGVTSWIGGSAPTIAASKYYEISVLNGVGVYFEV